MVLDLLQYLLLGRSRLQLLSQFKLSFDVTEWDSFQEHIWIANLIRLQTTELAGSCEGRVTCGRHLVWILEPPRWKFAVRSHTRGVAIVLSGAIIVGSTYLGEIILLLLAHCEIWTASVTIIKQALFLYHHALTVFIALSMIYLLDRIHKDILHGCVLDLRLVVYPASILKLSVEFCLVVDDLVLTIFCYSLAVTNIMKPGLWIIRRHWL